MTEDKALVELLKIVAKLCDNGGFIQASASSYLGGTPLGRDIEGKIRELQEAEAVFYEQHPELEAIARPYLEAQKLD